MMQKRVFPLLLVLVLGLSAAAFGQAPAGAPNHFAENGLSFDYPRAISLNDQSTEKGNHLIIQAQGVAQIMVMSRFEPIVSAEDLAEARREVTDAFVESMLQEFKKLDPNVTQTAVEIDVAGTKAPGTRLRAVLNNQSGNAEVYSLQLGRRLVLLTLIGSDKEIAASASAWLMIRSTIKVDDVAAADARSVGSR